MIRLLCLFVFSSLMLGDVALAQSEGDGSTALNSRIKRNQPFPTEPRSIFQQRELSALGKSRSNSMQDHFGACLWSRSNEKGLDYLARSDFGTNSWQQMGMTNEDVSNIYAIDTCLRRVANRNNSGVRMSYNAGAMRRWYLKEAYFDGYEDGPDWIVPGHVVGEREYPFSANNPAVHSAMNFADCMVSQDPHAADYFYRTGEGSAEESAAISLIVPVIEPCIDAGQTLDITPFTLRVWLGEALWHAANNSAAPTIEETQEP